MPQFDTQSEAAHAAGAAWSQRKVLDVIEHGFTHYRLTIQPISVNVVRRVSRVEEPGRIWLSLEDAHDAALPAPVKKLLTRLLSGE